jgi:DNA-binding NarL/FixJ family response regulator
VRKEAPLAELLQALRAVASGGTYIDSEMAGDLATGANAKLTPLTDREQQVLRMVADGMTNEKAAAALGISPETIQSHIRNTMTKLGSETRTQAVATAFRRSLLV